MTIKRLSPKQQLTVKWWAMPKYKTCDAIICDGAVRSGKTFSMSLGFISWAMTCFNGGDFAICGKTVTSLKRNVINPLIKMLGGLGFLCTEKVSKNYFDISLKGRVNRFYLFGGKDEGSASLIQGITLSGVFLDETALMPRSFVEQALARCSVSGSKMWFNCNPENPYHWFYREWIKKADEKKALYVHFTMEDNPSLSEKVKERYKRLYSGTFYDRFVLGRWTPSSAAEIFAMTQMQEAAVESNGKAYLPFGAEIIKTSAASDDLIIGLDRNFALELIKSSDLVMDTDKIINRQLDSIAVSVNCGFRKLTADAVQTLKITG